MGETAEGFRERAHFEADRYGTDPWVFVRELLQNARDADAREVRFRASESEGRQRLSCRDDGEGMSLEHAKRYLFRLYASSKLGNGASAGRFGIGFWSVLRFEPDVIVVRSRPRGGDGWEVRLDGALESASEGSLVMQPGTEVVLERRSRGDDVAASVRAAVRADAPWLRRRDAPDETLTVLVNDEPVGGGIELPQPNLSFETPGLRGVVALAGEPRVDVLAHGLRVRSASFLDELLLADAGGPPSSLELPEGLLPRVVLDSDRLRVLMARGDARDDEVLRQMVRLARRELDVLIRSELDRAAPVGRVARWCERVTGALRRRPAPVAAAAAVAGVVTVAAAAASLLLRTPPAAPPLPTPVPTAVVESRTEPFRNDSGAYRGPSVGELERNRRVDIRYRPESASPLLGVLRVPGLTDDGWAAMPPPAGSATPYVGPACDDDCLEMLLDVSATGGLMRVPVAAGHRIDSASVRLNGRPLEPLETASGEAALFFDGPAAGLLHYRSGPAPDRGAGAGWSWPEVPEQVADVVATLELLPAAERITAAEEIVRTVVAYDRSPETGRRLQQARLAGEPLLEAAVGVGRGDCDVQNALLAALLARSGLSAVLAVGYVGEGGRVLPGLHAWVEVLVDGRWQVADASGGASEEPEDPAPPERLAEAPVEVEAGLVSGAPAFEPADQPRLGSSLRDRLAMGAAVAAAAGAAVLIVVWIARRRRAPRRTLEADGAVDMARLLSGALARPDAYREAPALFDRPLVPLIGGRTLSLRRAMEAARKGRLLRSDEGKALARRAAGGGELVLDSSDPVAAAVADVLGARDIDVWDGIPEHAEAPAAAALAEAALRRLGARWRLLVAEGAPADVAVVEGSVLGLERASKYAVVDRSSALWQAASEGVEDRPGWSSLILAEGVADLLDLEPRQRRRWLARLAREAVEEGTGGES